MTAPADSATDLAVARRVLAIEAAALGALGDAGSAVQAPDPDPEPTGSEPPPETPPLAVPPPPKPHATHAPHAPPKE